MRLRQSLIVKLTKSFWNSWWACAARFYKSGPYFRPKKMLFFKSVFRPGL